MPTNKYNCCQKCKCNCKCKTGSGVEDTDTKKYEFKHYYDTNEEFRKKHKKYMLEKTKCKCGLMVTRNYMSRHKKTTKHLYLMTQIEGSDN